METYGWVLLTGVAAGLIIEHLFGTRVLAELRALRSDLAGLLGGGTKATVSTPAPKSTKS